MNLLEAILLGIIQGFTEFLPISSTGHLTVIGQLLNLIPDNHPEQWTSFIAVIQLGSLASLIIYFWHDIVSISGAFIKENIIKIPRLEEQSQDAKLGWLIIVGTIPIVVVGLLFKSSIEGAITKNLYIIAISLIALAVLLALAEKTAVRKKDLKNISIIDSIVIGLAQCVALIPGSSRSGTTITGGLFMGLKRETAARFSFLLSIPAILGSGLLQLFEALNYIDGSLALSMIVSTVVSAVSGYVAIDLLLKYLRKHSTFIFIYYRILIGIVILILLSLKIIQPY